MSPPCTRRGVTPCARRSRVTASPTDPPSGWWRGPAIAHRCAATCRSTATAVAPLRASLTAMVTPFRTTCPRPRAAQRLATHLVDSGNDGLVVNGTTGESPTTTDAEKAAVVRAVVEAVGDRALVVAGVGTQRHRATPSNWRQAAGKAGAHGLLVVTPYYNKPPQDGRADALHDGRRRHRPAGDALRHPRPHRRRDRRPRRWSGLAEHARIVAVKDAKGDLDAPSWVMARTRPGLVLRRRRPQPAVARIGGVGIVSVAGHLVGAGTCGDASTRTTPVTSTPRRAVHLAPAAGVHRRSSAPRGR